MSDTELIREWWRTSEVKDRKLVTFISQKLKVPAHVVYDALGIPPFPRGRPRLDRAGFIRQLRDMEPFSTEQAASVFGIKNTAAHSRLDRLADEGLVRRVERPPRIPGKIAPRNTVFWETTKQEKSDARSAGQAGPDHQHEGSA